MGFEEPIVKTKYKIKKVDVYFCPYCNIELDVLKKNNERKWQCPECDYYYF